MANHKKHPHKVDETLYTKEKIINIDSVIMLSQDINDYKNKLNKLIKKNKSMYSPGDNLIKSNLLKNIKALKKKLKKKTSK